MKLCYITMEVPDDFDTDEDIEGVQFAEGVDYEKVNVTGCQELEPRQQLILSDEEAEKFRALCKIKKDEVTENSVIRLMLPSDFSNMDAAFFSQTKDLLEATYKCPILVMVDDMNLLVENADASIDMLNKMIAKIKVRSAVKDTSGIVLPN